MRERDRTKKEDKGKTKAKGSATDIITVGNEEGRTPGHFVALYGMGNVGSGLLQLLTFSRFFVILAFFGLTFSFLFFHSDD